MSKEIKTIIADGAIKIIVPSSKLIQAVKDISGQAGVDEKKVVRAIWEKIQENDYETGFTMIEKMFDDAIQEVVEQGEHIKA